MNRSDLSVSVASQNDPRSSADLEVPLRRRDNRVLAATFLAIRLLLSQTE